MTPKSDPNITPVSTKRGKTAVFPGTFNPFTIGHRSIVERALAVFDRVVIAIGYNEHKSDIGDLRAKEDKIREAFSSNPAVEVASYSGLTADFVRSIGACAILRGVRNITDFEYERNLADVNKKILGVETVLMISLPDYSFISSSMVRELEANGHHTGGLTI